MNNKTKNQMLGNLGEKLVAHYFSKQGYNVDFALDPFDSEKDLVVEGYTCEVKTQQPYHILKSFTIRKSQLKKCMSVNMNFFVETPSEQSNWCTKIYLCPKDHLNFEPIGGNNDRLKINIKNMKLLQTINDKKINNRMIELSTSKWQGKNYAK